MAGANAVGHDAVYAGSLGSQGVKIFDRVVARTGLRPHEAAEHGFNARTVDITVDDHKAYYPGAAGNRRRARRRPAAPRRPARPRPPRSHPAPPRGAPNVAVTRPGSNAVGIS